MFKIIVLVCSLATLSAAFTNHATAGTGLSSTTSGYVYGPPQGVGLNYDGRNLAGYNNAWSGNKWQQNGLGYNAGLGYNSGLGYPHSYQNQYYQNQYTTPGYYNNGYNAGYNNNQYNPWPYNNNYQHGGYQPATGWNYNRPYYSTIQNRH